MVFNMHCGRKMRQLALLLKRLVDLQLAHFVVLEVAMRDIFVARQEPCVGVRVYGELMVMSSPLMTTKI